ncbi:hypothetical protein WCU81_06055 [Pectobacterium atrosepticum]|uniref:membrane protein n=1 Tax=Pectobacterium atrosepticum TaxID=29471 RepID=UPI0004FF962B|nr:membrane protein [Pectobacterium atrosepticum]GKV86241.1 hypothetical protein PEC301296_25530 [Pectobacterium carotovorum subsp. carotovorum]KFX16773.1 membrane protein [Pectobacterium atrosepticum]KMK80582.1 hypothetical protein KCQ_13815 [Pectobacterium atrosepticum ICMP 1526]MCL6390717.1 hypothetical protein [Pectobacterium atrosepticum]MDK9445218.1 hypothetical protein [Pectobacterium atrosepticum]
MEKEKNPLSKEEQFIILIDKYITDTYSPSDEIFTYKLYLIFVGYHLKYFHPQATYSNSISNIDNIMQMFCSVFKCMKSNFIKTLNNKEVLFFQLNALVDYIEGNQIRLEQVYVELKAQYEKREISKGVINKGNSRKRVRL